MSDPAYSKRARVWYTIAVLMVVTFLASLDRQIPNFLVGPIRHTMGISDTEISLIQGPSFALMFCLMGLPLGWLVDRISRRNIICGGLVVWSATTIYCGFASSFWQLFIGRVGVGFGEAALSPAAYSLIADLVEPRKRGRTLAFYFFAAALSAGIALVLIGYLLRLGPQIASRAPALLHFESWQLAFVLAGISSFALVPFLLTIGEVPRRGGSGALIDDTQPKAGMLDFFRYAVNSRRAFFCMYGAFACLQFSNMASYTWAPSLYIRKFHMVAKDVGVHLGLVIIAGAFFGTLLSTIMVDRWATRARQGGRFLLACVSCAVIIPFHLAWPLINDPIWSFAAYGLASAGTSFGYASAAAIVQDVVPNRMRGKAIAVYLLLSGIAGYAIAPTAVALVTDRVFKNDAALPYSLIICLVPAALTGFILAVRGLTAYSELKEALGRLEASNN
jgi:MFS family permease